MKKILLILLLWIAPQIACASALVADLSTYRIDIDSGFTGTRIFLFGARNEGGDVVVVIRGEPKTFTIRKKERIGGIWVNGKWVRFFGLPDFYAVASTREGAFPQEGLYSAFDIGGNNLFKVGMKGDKKHAEDFAQAFLEHQKSRRLIREDAKLQFMGETLFKTTVEFPDTIPKGNYTAEIYLIKGNELVGVQTIPIKVSKSGLDAAVSNLAHNAPILYGLLAVFLALSAGWAASRLFERT